MTELSKHLGISCGCLVSRLANGLPLSDPLLSEKKYEYKGRYYTSKQLGRKLKLKPALIRERARHGKDIAAPLAAPHKYEFRGEMYTIRELAKLLGVEATTIKCRFARGMPIDYVDQTSRYDVGGGRKLTARETIS